MDTTQQAQTLTEKIFSEKAGRAVTAGEYLLLDVDVALGNDITAPVAIKEFEKFNGRELFDPDRIVFVADHFTPNKDIQSAMQVKMVRDFSRTHGIKKFYDVGKMGIEHVLLPEQGLVKSGDLVVGADSHTCTYGALGAFSTGVGSTDLAGVFFTGKAWFKVPEAIRVELKGSFSPGVSGKDLILHIISELGVDGANYQAIEFTGPGVAEVSMDSRFTVSNMAIEAGGKAGLFPVDDVTRAYESQRGIEAAPRTADDGARYSRTLEIDLNMLEATVARPFLPENGAVVSALASEKVKVDQVVIGSCTNGRIEDLRSAAAVLGDARIAEGVRCIILPGSQEVYLQSMREGLTEKFVTAGCVFSTPTCGPCLGGHMGILAEKEVALSTTNRNFVGRMGHASSEVYLASPAVAAATAVQGYICGPDAPALERLGELEKKGPETKEAVSTAP